MANNFYTESMPYEWFIRRAHKSLKSMRNGASQSFMQNLMLAEVGSSYVSHLPNYDKQLEKVKSYMDKALDKFLKLQLTLEERERLLNLKKNLSYAYSTNHLMDIVKEGLELTERFKE